MAAAPLTAGMVFMIVAVLVTTTSLAGNNDDISVSNGSKTKSIAVTVNVGEPQESPIQSRNGSSVMTTYLPVNITQTINLAKPTENMTLYPIFERWDGLVRGQEKIVMVDKNNNTIPKEGGFGVASILHTVVATCTEPYFVNVTNTDGSGNGGIQFENTTMPVPSSIAWGGPSIAVFTEPQSGTLYDKRSGYGIVPADYNDDYNEFFTNTGAGNQEVSGTYHLSFVSFYPATVNLPEQANMTSFLEVKCTIEEADRYVETSELPHIYVYDVWFEIG